MVPRYVFVVFCTSTNFGVVFACTMTLKLNRLPDLVSHLLTCIQLLNVFVLLSDSHWSNELATLVLSYLCFLLLSTAETACGAKQSTETQHWVNAVCSSACRNYCD